MIDGDRAEFEEYDPVDYDMYSYDNQMVSNRRIDAELPTPVWRNNLAANIQENCTLFYRQS